MEAIQIIDDNLVEDTMRKIVLGSFAMRFYAQDGWSMPLLCKYVLRGRMVERVSESLDPYYICDGVMDIDRLLNDFPTIEVATSWKEDIGKSKRELLEARNY